MKTAFTFALTAIAVSCFGFPGEAAAAEKFNCYQKEQQYANDFLQLGTAAEKAGDTLAALLYYQGAFECIKTKKHRQRIKKVLTVLVDKAEKNGHLYSKGAFITTFDKKCPETSSTWGVEREWYKPGVFVTCKVHGGGVRMKLKDNAGSFDLNEAAAFYAEADRAMMQYVKSVTEDFDAFETVYNHFRKRKTAVEDKHTIQMYKGYKHIEGYNADLKKISIGNMKFALEREAAIFDKKAVESAISSLKELEKARKWVSYLAKEEEREVVKRAEKRGDVMANIPKNPIALQRAVEYYGVAHIPQKIIKTRQRADELGRYASKKHDWKTAAHYFQISGNRKGMRDAESRIK